MADIQTLFLVATFYFVIIERFFELVFTIAERYIQDPNTRNIKLAKKAFVYVVGLIVGTIIASGTEISFLQVIGVSYASGSLVQWIDFLGTGLFFAAGPTGWHQIIKLLETYKKQLNMNINKLENKST